jgi:hypothetical protein
MVKCNACKDTGRIPLITRADQRPTICGTKIVDRVCHLCVAGQTLFDQAVERGAIQPDKLADGDVIFFYPRKR